MHSSELRTVEISPPARFLFLRGEGFDADEVDALLSRSADALEIWERGTGVPEFDPDEIVVAQFRYSRLGRTYDPDQVDDLLDEIVEQLREHQAAAGATG